MTPKQLRMYIEKIESLMEDSDGFDQAWLDGMRHVLNECNDGGISEQYLDGVATALKLLTVYDDEE